MVGLKQIQLLQLAALKKRRLISARYLNLTGRMSCPQKVMVRPKPLKLVR